VVGWLEDLDLTMPAACDAETCVASLVQRLLGPMTDEKADEVSAVRGVGRVMMIVVMLLLMMMRMRRMMMRMRRMPMTTMMTIPGSLQVVSCVARPAVWRAAGGGVYLPLAWSEETFEVPASGQRAFRREVYGNLNLARSLFVAGLTVAGVLALVAFVAAIVGGRRRQKARQLPRPDCMRRERHQSMDEEERGGAWVGPTPPFRVDVRTEL
jgi:hypothetical protein